MLKPQNFYADADEKYRYDMKDILEMEMKILEALNYYPVVYHPYRECLIMISLFKFFNFCTQECENYEKNNYFVHTFLARKLAILRVLSTQLSLI